MIPINHRAAGIGQLAKAVTQACGGQRVTASFPSLKRDWDERAETLPQLIPAFAVNMPLHKFNLPSNKGTFNLNFHLFKNKSQALNGIGVSHQYRFAHTDITIPDFSTYRRPSNKDLSRRSADSKDDRRAFTYLMTAGVGVGGTVLAKHLVHGIVNLMSPANDCLALSKIEVNIGSIPEGKNVTVKWRGKPVFIRRRTQEEISREKAVNLSELRDPEPDEKRAPNPEWLVVVGICTHLGCVPIAGKGDFGGYYCPCHGSHYDASGRIRKGPAPANLEIPDHVFEGDTLIIG